MEVIRRDPSSAAWGGVLLLLVATSILFGFPAPAGVVFLGLVIGSLVAFISIGIVLIYRTNRIINFAQADIGAAGAVLTVLLIGQLHWNYFAAAAVGLVVAVTLGGLVELTIVRRFFKAPRLILTVATIALTQVLVVVEVLLPRAFGRTFVNIDFLTPFSASFSVKDFAGGLPPVRFDGNHVLAILTVPLVILALGSFFKFTRVGIAARGAADNSERASLLGIPVKRVSTMVWMLSAAISAIGAFLRAPTVGLPVLGGAFDSGLLVRSLAPAVAGKMENLRTTFLAALVLGVIDQAAFYQTHSPALSNTILFAVILVSLLLRRGDRASRVQDLDASSWKAVHEVRPVPAQMRKLPEVLWARRGVVIFAVVAALGAGLFTSSSRTSLASLILIYAMLGASLVILTGWAGQISLGQVGFFAVGAAVCARLAIDAEMNLLLALAIAGLAGGFSAVVIGLPALRIKGLFLAASTVSFGLFVSSTVLDPRYFGWLLPSGRYVRPIVMGIDLNSERSFYFFSLAFFLIIVGSIKSLRRSRTGRVLIGARDNERSARSYGINVTRARLAAFALSGFYAAVAGGLYAMHQNAVIASSLGVEKSMQVFVMVVIGGMASLPGVLLGAIYFFATQYFLTGAASLLASGLGMLVLIMVVPGGLGQIMFGRRDAFLRWVADRRGLMVPSLVADGLDEDAPVPVPVAQGQRRLGGEP